MTGVAGGEGCFARAGDICDLDVADLHRPANLPLPGGDCGCAFRRTTLERPHAPAQDLVDGAVEGVIGIGRAGGLGASKAKPKRISKIVMVVVQTASGGCASNQRSTASSTDTHAHHRRQHVGTNCFGRSLILAAPRDPI